MKRSIHLEPTVSNVLQEIGDLLRGYVGETITFNDFTAIMDKDNSLSLYKRTSLLHFKSKFFKKEVNKNNRNGKNIIMKTQEDFLPFLNYLETKIKLDLQKFKKTVIYCIRTGYCLPGKKRKDFQPVAYRAFEIRGRHA